MILFQNLVDFIMLLLGILLSYFEAVYRVVVKRRRKSVEQDIILVTGAGHGIGREVALTFGRLGAKIVLLDINKANNDATAHEINTTGGEAVAYVCDVADPESVRQVGERVRKDVGDVTMLVNNAGILNGGAVLDIKDKDIKKTFDVNVLAHFWTVREFLPAMLERDQGHIVTMASVVATVGEAFLTDYSASKWAVFGFSESLKEELFRLERTGINISIVCPYLTDTGMTKFPRFNKFDRFLTPTEAAESLVDGVLRDEEVIFIPALFGFFLTLAKLLPRRGGELLRRYLGTGIDPQYVKND